MATAWRFELSLEGDLSAESWRIVMKILSEALGAGPKDLHVQRDARGRPFLRDFPDVDFNLSHTPGFGLLAVNKGGRVGVDLQKFKALENPTALASELFGPEIVKRLAGLGLKAQNEAFLGLWVRAEALLKATGEGLPRSGAVLNDPAFWPGEERLIERQGRRWSLLNQRLECDIFAALACEVRQRGSATFDLRSWP